MKNKFKIILVFLLSMFVVGCKPEPKPPVKEPFYTLYSLDEVDGFKFNLDVEATYLTSILFLENGSKLENIEYPFKNAILPAQDNKNRILFDKDFKVIVHVGDQNLEMSFHNKQYVTIQNITFPLQELPFKENIDEKMKQFLTTGKNLTGHDFFTHPIDTITTQLHLQGFPIQLTIKSNEAKEKFIQSFEKLELSTIQNEQEQNDVCPQFASIMELTTEIKMVNGEIIHFKPGCKSLTVEHITYKEESSWLNNTILNIINNNLFHYTFDFGVMKQEIYLKPLHVETKDYLFIGEPIKPSDQIQVNLDEHLINFAQYGLTAFENDIQLNQLPLDNQPHILHFKDQSGNLYEYYYNCTDFE